MPDWLSARHHPVTMTPEVTEELNNGPDSSGRDLESPPPRPIERRTNGAQSIERAFGILRFIAGTGKRGARLCEVAEKTGLAQPTVHRILQVLEHEGAVLRAPEGKRYLIGSELALLGLSTALRELRSIASPFLRRLCDAVGDAVFLSVASGLDTVCADRRIGSYPIQILSIDVGSRRPLGVSVNGMAILSRTSEKKTQEILEANAQRFVPYKVSAEMLAEHIARARERSYVFVEAALVKNTRAVAVPILSSAGVPIAAVSTIAITRRIPIQRVPELVSTLKSAAEEISQSLHEAAKHKR